MNKAIRKIDKLGRLVLPIDFRKFLQLETNEAVVLEMKKDGIFITKSSSACKLCGAATTEDHFLCICTDCIEKVKML